MFVYSKNLAMDATPAAFVAHVQNRKMQKEIAKAYVNSGIDIFIGAGKGHFYSPKDTIDLVPALQKKRVLGSVQSV